MVYSILPEALDACWALLVPNTCVCRAWVYGVWIGCEGQQKQNGKWYRFWTQTLQRAEAATYVVNMVICKICFTFHSVPVFWCCMLQVKTHGTKKIVLTSFAAFHYLSLSVLQRQKTEWLTCIFKEHTSFLSSKQWRSGKRHSSLKCACQQHFSMFFKLHSTTSSHAWKGRVMKALYWRVSSIWVRENPVNT